MRSESQGIRTSLSRRCPYCFGEMVVERLRCSHCHVAVEGVFESSPLTLLQPDQQDLIVDYLRLDGSLKDLAAAKGVSYPTIRSRMDKVIEALNAASDRGRPEQRSQNVLEALEKGEISADEAERLLKKKEANAS